MTLASLVVKLSVEAADFHRDMEAVGRRVETTGRQIARAGHELSLAVSLPILAQGFLAFYAVLERSKVTFGPLFQAFEQLKAAGTSLYVQLGTVLEPVFLKMIQSLEGTIAWVKSLIAAFQQLSPTVQKIIIDTLLFLAYLGPTVLAVGKLVGALGAVPKLIGLLTSATGLWVIGILALVGALAYVATHWDQTKLQLVLAWTFIEEKVFDAIDGILSGIGFLVDAIPILSKAVASIQNDFETFADRTLAQSAVAIQKLEHSIALAAAGVKGFKGPSNEAQKALDELSQSMRLANGMAQVFGPTFDKSGAEVQALQKAIESLLKTGMSPLSAKVQDLGTQLQAAKLQQVADQIGRSSTQIDTNAASPLYNVASAQAQALNKAVQDAITAGAALDDVVGKDGPRLRDLIKAADDATKKAAALQSINAGLQTAIVDSFSAIGDQIGAIIGGLAHGFSGFGKVIEGILGTLMKTIGQAMVAFGIAGLAIKNFIKSPAAAIAAGIALIAIGSALSSAAQGAVNAAGSAGGGSAGAAAPSSSYSATQDTGQVIVMFPKGPRLFDPNDADQVEAYREFFANLTGRDVLVQVGS
ncbi:MAG TPA: hypothetical protein VNN08_16235 [Thermoanaerobaculia bacterium]|nr:hypothetical protein [Thermoanaerobaculia bacterium]